MLTGLVTVTVMLHSSLRADMRDVQTEMRALRTEVREDIEGLRTEVREDIEVLRTETREDIEGLRTETREDIGNLRDDIQALRDDIQALLAAKASPTDAATGQATMPAAIPAPPDSALAPHAGSEPGALSALDGE